MLPIERQMLNGWSDSLKASFERGGRPRNKSAQAIDSRFRMGAALNIDIVAVVKEALRDSEVRDQIRAIVLEVAPAPANDVEDLLDARAAAAFLGMTPAALRMAVYRGTIRCLRIGRRLRFRRSELMGR